LPSASSTEEGAGTLPMIGTFRRTQISQSTTKPTRETMPRQVVLLSTFFRSRIQLTPWMVAVAVAM